ncbi:MAG: hypothetical protein ACI9XJ_001882 [Marivirga sp.]|jgi:hypothetical protein
MKIVSCKICISILMVVVSTASLFGQNSTLSFPFDNGATQIANTDISGTKAGGVSSVSDRFGNSNSAFYTYR